MQAKIVVFSYLMCSAGIEGLYSTYSTDHNGDSGTYMGYMVICVEDPEYMCSSPREGSVRPSGILQAVLRKLFLTAPVTVPVLTFDKFRFRFRLRI